MEPNFTWENWFFKSFHYDIPLKSLLQPGDKDDCIWMTLLFGTVPSWYSWPCIYLRCYLGPVICKRRPPPFHVTTRKKHTVCHSGELFALGNCFAIKPRLNVPSLHEQAITPNVKEYFINLFSFITRQTLLAYQLHMKTYVTNSTENGFCVRISLTAGLPYDVGRRVTTYKSTCRLSNSYRALSILNGNTKTGAHCQPNQITCKDKTCVSHKFLCTRHDDCSAVRCSCELAGKLIVDQKFCRNVCLPNNCSCPWHYFQCTCGGCIHMSSICDGVSDCRDSSDEICVIKIRATEPEEIEMEILLTETYFCLGFLCLSSQCIYQRKVNDLIPDCPGGGAEDEPQFLQLRYNSSHYDCRDPMEMSCIPGLPVCFTLEQFCLFEIDEDGNPRWCRNGAHLGDCSIMNCTNSYKCPESYCIPFHRVCDGFPDCIHGEEEERCHEYSCKGLLRCTATKVCFHPTYVCDGIPNCPSGDDEELCDMKFCPHNCDCFSYSISCAKGFSNTIPTMPLKLVKHISIMFYSMPYPDFYNISDQVELLILNLTRNSIRNICVPFQQNYESIIDLSHNEITSLQSACFEKLVSLKILSLAYNPLLVLHKDSLSSFSISYISLRKSPIKLLYGNSLSQYTKYYYLDMRGIRLQYLDSFAAEVLSEYIDVTFDDSRLCCLFTQQKYCVAENIRPALCTTLLPTWFIGYIILPTGVVITVVNIYAFHINLQLSQGSHHSKITAFLIFIDCVMASYLPAIGVAELHYKSTFVLVSERWQKGFICRLLESLSTVTTILSPFLSGLLVFLTSKGITNVKFYISEYSHTIAFTLVGITIISICFTLSLTMMSIFANGSFKSRRYICNMMGESDINSNTDTLFAISLSVLMLAMCIWITISSMKVILQIRKTTKEVEQISKIKLNSTRRKAVCKFMISLVIMKLILYVPYPLLQIILLYAENVPKVSSLYVVVSFIILECSLNPSAFVLRSLLAQRQKTGSWPYK